MWSLISFTVLLLPLTLAAPSSERRGTAPTVSTTNAQIIGSSLLGVDSFKGIPFALPPTGQLRLKPPQPITSNQGIIQATGIPLACPQFYTSTNTTFLPIDVITEVIDSGFIQKAVLNAGENCLTLNVQRPSTATAGSKLPVVFWIYGGAFEFGSTGMYDASELVLTSIAQSKPVVYVSVSYRVGGFGFLGGKEIKADGSSNLGLLDQRLALQWVADNIAAFGGDPTKVTIWGESAGAISVFDQMALYNGDNTYKGKALFRGAIMDSGSITPTNPVDGPRAQGIYDTVVKNSGCAAAANTLACLRGLDYETFLKATTSVPGFTDYSSVALSYLPRPDGTVLTASPDVLAKNGQFASVPFIIGDQEDEGTLFSLVQANLSTTADLVNYFKNVFFLSATQAQVQSLVDLYPNDPTAGSPYNTGLLNIVYPQYKRLAAMLGDLVFTLTRRTFLTLAASAHPSVPSWSYLASYDYGTPILGTFHGSDILTTYGITPGIPSLTIQAYYLSFINELDPNTGTVGFAQWPQWSISGRALNHFLSTGTASLVDNFREAAYQFILTSGPNFYI